MSDAEGLINIYAPSSAASIIGLFEIHDY